MESRQQPPRIENNEKVPHSTQRRLLKVVYIYNIFSRPNIIFHVSVKVLHF